VVKTCLTIVWLLVLIDRFGRRNLLLVGAAGGSLCMWYLGAYLAIQPASTKPGPLTSAGKSAIFFFYLWTAFYTPTWNGTPWVLNSEWYQVNMRPLGQSFASANNWFWNFLVSRFTPQMFLTMGSGVYFFFATLMLLSIPFVYFLIPETKSVPLEAMDKLFLIKPTRKAHGEVMAELRMEEEIFRRDSIKEAQEKVMEIENASSV
jgi:Sugar (and other) transporter